MLSLGKTATPFHFWISFWPVAPMFGVEWRFQKFVPGPSYFRPADIAAKMTAAGLSEAVKATAEATEAVARATDAAVEAVAAPACEAAAEFAQSIVEAAAPVEIEVPPPVEADLVDKPMAVRPAFLFEGRPEDADDLKRIKGVGPKLEEMLNGMGIFRFAQIADFEPGHLAWVDENLTAFKGRPFRDDWVAQAKALL